MSKEILTVGFQLAADGPRFEWFSSKASLLDFDIVLIHPTFKEYIANHTATFQGKPCLNDDVSFDAKEACEHWRREIHQAVELGKTVIVFLPTLTEVYVATGAKSTSGTGRNQSVSRHVNTLSNYKIIPLNINPTNASGSAMKLASQFTDAFASYWNDFGSQSSYKVSIEGDISGVAITTRAGEKATGAVVRSKNSSGLLVLLPELDFDQTGFVTADRKYTKKALVFANKLISAVVTLDRSLRATAEKTVRPAWANIATYDTQETAQLKQELLQAEDKAIAAQIAKEEIKRKITDAESLRGLLYEKGLMLERAIIEALNLLGFIAQGYKKDTSEFDVIFESAEGRLLGEAEGRDNKAINIGKLRQLSMNIHEDLARPEIDKPAKGVLFGDGYRLTSPDERQCQFTDKCVEASQISSTALVTTVDLFAVSKYLKDTADLDYAQSCRRCLLTNVGLLRFPDPPTVSSNTKDVSEEHSKEA